MNILMTCAIIRLSRVSWITENIDHIVSHTYTCRIFLSLHLEPLKSISWLFRGVKLRGPLSVLSFLDVWWMFVSGTSTLTPSNPGDTTGQDISHIPWVFNWWSVDPWWSLEVLQVVPGHAFRFKFSFSSTVDAFKCVYRYPTEMLLCFLGNNIPVLLWKLTLLCRVGLWWTPPTI